MAQGKHESKSDRNPCIRYSDNFDTDGQRWMNFDFMSSADIVPGELMTDQTAPPSTSYSNFQVAARLIIPPSFQAPSFGTP